MRNSKNTIEQSIKRITLLSSTIITFVVASIIGIVLIKTEYSNFKNHISNFKQTLIDREKFYIKTGVENLKNDIEFEKISILNSKKHRIKNQSIIAYNLAVSLHKKTRYLTKEEQTNIIISALRQISKKGSDIHYFILNQEGTVLLNTQDTRDEGSNFLDFEDINGVKFINKMLEAPLGQQNYLEYYWYKPNKRVTYSRHLHELGLIVGSSSFMESSNDLLTQKILKKIVLQEFNEEEFIFIYRIDSLNNITTQNSVIIERNISLDQKEIEAVEALMIDTGYKGNDYVIYDDGNRMIYGTFLNRLRYFIGVGTHLKYIDAIVEKERDISLHNMNEKISNLAVIIVIMIIIFFLFSLIFTRKIEKLFSQYRKRVKENEEKYALLFNHSNDGFIISEVQGKATSILSVNSMALQLTAYEKKELLYKDFFTLFVNFDLQMLLEKKSLFKTVELRNHDGQIRTVELNAIIYTHESKELVFASLRDITERTLLKEEKSKQENILIQKSKMAAMGEMIGNIAHQWRQPLSQVAGLFLDIESAYEFNELNKKYLSKRVDEANDILDYMSKTIDDFRNFFNPNSKKEYFLINESVQSALSIVQSTLKYHNIELEIACDTKCTIYGYKNEYAQAIVNIVSNAKDILIERAIKEPKIKIYTSSDDLNLCIEDNAGGIEPHILDKIFDPYFTTKRNYGTGIGLYMTKLIIEEKMNGAIDVENSKDGAVFTLKV